MCLSKACFKCGEMKPIDSFYVHPRMGDGHLNKCKECIKVYVSQYGKKNRERLTLIARLRRSTPEGKVVSAARRKRYALRYPERRRANLKVSHAIRDGRLVPLPCTRCGRSPAEAHHPDYHDPFGIVWLCQEHHRDLLTRIV